jgi:hypothetical protein
MLVYGAGQRSLSGWMQVKVSQSDGKELGIGKCPRTWQPLAIAGDDVVFS